MLNLHVGGTGHHWDPIYNASASSLQSVIAERQRTKYKDLKQDDLHIIAARRFGLLKMGEGGALGVKSRDSRPAGRDRAHLKTRRTQKGLHQEAPAEIDMTKSFADLNPPQSGVVDLETPSQDVWERLALNWEWDPCHDHLCHNPRTMKSEWERNLPNGARIIGVAKGTRDKGCVKCTLDGADDTLVRIQKGIQAPADGWKYCMECGKKLRPSPEYSGSPLMKRLMAARNQ